MERKARHLQEEPDALDEMIGEFTEVNPDFPQLLLAAEHRRATLAKQDIVVES